MSSVATVSTGAVSDAELVLASRTGDATSLGLLLERYRPSLYGAALQMLGHGHEAEDAVHETFLIALRRLDDVRDPAAIGGWLHAVVRNVCRMELRRRGREVLVDEPEQPRMAVSARSIDEELEQLALGDWVWATLDQLSEPLRLTVMLRHFSRLSSYDEIAAVCGVPVGTVRSRLNQARLKLADALLDAAAPAASEARALTRMRTRDLVQVSDEINRRRMPEALLGMFTPDVVVNLPGRTRLRGRHAFAQILEDDLAAGVTMQLVRVIAGRGITIVEGRFQNPPDDPFHCPPELTHVYLDSGGESHTVLVHLADRIREPD